MITARVTNVSRRAGSVAFLIALSATRVFGHGDIMRMGSSAAGGGRLEIEPGFDFGLEVVVTEVTTVGDRTLFQAVIPSFAWVLPGDPSLHPIDPTATVAMRIERIDVGASVRLSDRILDAPGETANIGRPSTDPDEHVHPEWRLILPTGVTGRYAVSFVLVTAALGYQTSPVYTLVLTNIVPDVATPTATPTPSTAGDTPTSSPTPSESTNPDPSATPTPSPSQTPNRTATVAACPSDCNGDREVTVDELVRAVGIALGTGVLASCPTSDLDGDGEVSVTELVRAVNVAMRGCGS